jgi:hypothetical protein
MKHENLYIGEHRGIWAGPVLRDKETNYPVAFVAGGSENLAKTLAAAPETLRHLETCIELLAHYEQVERDLGNELQAQALHRHIKEKSDFVRSVR